MPGPVVNETILKLALTKRRLANGFRGVLPLTGVPGVSEVRLAYVDHLITVTEINGETLSIPIEISTLQLPPKDVAYRVLMERSQQIKSGDNGNGTVTVSADDLKVDDGSVVGRDAARWYPVVGGGLQPEPQAQDAAGHDVAARVDTGVYCWRLTCECGRVRFAKRNSVHQVSRCRICTKLYRKQQRRSSSQQTTT